MRQIALYRALSSGNWYHRTSSKYTLSTAVICKMGLSVLPVGMRGCWQVVWCVLFLNQYHFAWWQVHCWTGQFLCCPTTKQHCSVPCFVCCSVVAFIPHWVWVLVYLPCQAIYNRVSGCDIFCITCKTNETGSNTLIEFVKQSLIRTNYKIWLNWCIWGRTQIFPEF